MAMNIDSMRELYVHTLQDLLSAEKQILEGLKQMQEAATSPDLRDAFAEHFEQTQVQAQQVERLLTSLGEKPGSEKCKGIEGIIKEGAKMIEEIDDPETLDAALITGAQKVEHYEIATYGAARTFAQMLGEEQAVEVLSRILDEESETDEKLTDLAMSGVNQAAMHDGD